MVDRRFRRFGGAVIYPKKNRRASSKTFLNLCAAVIHLKIFINTDSLLRWDVEQAR